MPEYHENEGLTADPYLARMSASSPRTASDLLAAARWRSAQMRLWVYDVLEQVAWGFHGPDCLAPWLTTRTSGPGPGHGARHQAGP